MERHLTLPVTITRLNEDLEALCLNSPYEIYFYLHDYKSFLCLKEVDRTQTLALNKQEFAPFLRYIKQDLSPKQLKGSLIYLIQLSIENQRLQHGESLLRWLKGSTTLNLTHQPLNDVMLFLLIAVEHFPNQAQNKYIRLLKGTSNLQRDEKLFGLLKAYPEQYLNHTYYTLIKQEFIGNKEMKLQLTTKGSFTLSLMKPNWDQFLNPPTLTTFHDFIQQYQADLEMYPLFWRAQTLTTIHPEELPLLIQFIQSIDSFKDYQRNMLVSLIVKILPPQYAPLLEMNSYLATGMAQEVLQEISQKLSQPSIKP